MYSKYIRHLTLMVSLAFAIPSTVMAGEATDRIKNTTDKLIAIVTDPDLEPIEMAGKRNRLIRAAVDEVFDWEEFSQRALARHWRKRTNDEKKEFISLFGQLLERTYMDKSRSYSGEKIVFLDESIDGNYGVVTARVTLKSGKEVEIDYRVIKKDGIWFVYDVYVEGVSLVNNYRVQFKSIIMKSSYKELVTRLKAKLK
ncbi:phospholipid-binding protein MlaC [Thermodesulfobacteriota bacterium]